MAINDKTYINLFKSGRWFKGSDKTNKFNAYLFEANPEKQDEGIMFWVLFYATKEELADKVAGKDPEVKKVLSIKEKTWEYWTFLSWVYIDDVSEEVFWVNLYDNDKKKGENDYDKVIIMKEAEFRWEKKETVPAVEWADENGDLPF